MRHFLHSTSPLLPLRWMASGVPSALHRFLVVRSLSAAVVLAGCVPVAKYEEAQSATEVAQEAERRTAARLAEVEAALEALQEAHAAAQGRLAEYDAEASQAALDRAHLEQQRDEHAELVNQLRSELERVGEHLRVYSQDRTALSERLEAAQTEIERLQTRLEELREASRPTAEEEQGVHDPSEPDGPAGTSPQAPSTAGSRAPQPPPESVSPESVSPEKRPRSSDAAQGPASEG